MSGAYSLYPWLAPDLRTMREIAEVVGDRHELTLEDLRQDTRRHCIAHPRQEAMAEMYATGRFSNGQIARFFRLKDHSTVVHARQAVADRQREAA